MFTFTLSFTKMSPLKQPASGQTRFASIWCYVGHAQLDIANAGFQKTMKGRRTSNCWNTCKVMFSPWIKASSLFFSKGFWLICETPVKRGLIIPTSLRSGVVLRVGWYFEFLVTSMLEDVFGAYREAICCLERWLGLTLSHLFKKTSHAGSYDAHRFTKTDVSQGVWFLSLKFEQPDPPHPRCFIVFACEVHNVRMITSLFLTW